MKETLNNRIRYFDNLRQSIGIAYLNLSIFILLFMIEISIAIMTDSKALLAAGFNNLSSIIISVGVLVGLRVSLKDPSHSHSKGYQQFETLGNLFSSFVMFLMSAYIVIEGGRGSISSFSRNVVPRQSSLAVVVAIGAGTLMLITYFTNRKAYQKIESNSINTLMKDSFSDMLMNFGTALGILLSIEVDPLFDGLTAVLLGLILCRMSYLIVKENVFHLSGGFDPEMIENYQHVIEVIPGIERIVDITGKMFGDAVAVDVTVEVLGELTVNEGAIIANTIEQELAIRFDVFDVDVQIRPRRMQ